MSALAIRRMLGCVTALVLASVASAEEANLDACHALDDRGAAEAKDCYHTVLAREAEPALRAEALWRLGELAAANRAFQRAAAARPDDPDVRARWGMLFLAAHQAGDAAALFEEALAMDPDHVGALLGQAELMVDGFSGPARAVIARIVNLAPDDARPLLLQARLDMEAAALEAARENLLSLAEAAGDPAPGIEVRLQAMALLAAADHLDGTARAGLSESPWVERALALNPHYGDVYAVPAHYYVITRRYEEAVSLYEKAVAVQPTLWSAQAALGSNLLRLNRMDEGQQALTRAYQGDPFDAGTVNTLRLLDSLDGFDEQASDTLILRTHPEETAVLTPYVEELVERTATEMAPRYGYELERPVVLELYQHHDDFAVRTAGLPGLGILGATFGDVVVMDGPSAKPAAEFDWYTAVWHELAHVVTLNATDNLVSRWFSEGVSVHEERLHGPTPSESVPFHFLEALASDRLLAVAELDRGFMRPEYENQIAVSYVQAGLLCSYIAASFERGLTRILTGYRAGLDTVAALEQGLGMSTGELDQRFFAHLDERYGGAAGSLTEISGHIGAAREALRGERWTDALASADAAIALFPAYVDTGSAYLLKASAAQGAGDITTVRTALTEYYRRGGRDPEALARAARLAHEAGAVTDALTIQRTLARLDPLRATHHATLGDWLGGAGEHAEALIEYQAVLALDPHDRARAHYHVASALQALARTEEARRELLLALEIAPRFSPALSLLVEISQ